MPSIGAALGNDLDFGAGGAIEVSGLVGCVHLELFDAVDRGRHDTGGRTTDS